MYFPKCTLNISNKMMILQYLRQFVAIKLRSSIGTEMGQKKGFTQIHFSPYAKVKCCKINQISLHEILDPVPLDVELQAQNTNV